jgi:hypothetical protein
MPTCRITLVSLAVAIATVGLTLMPTTGFAQSLLERLGLPNIGESIFGKKNVPEYEPTMGITGVTPIGKIPFDCAEGDNKIQWNFKLHPGKNQIPAIDLLTTCKYARTKGISEGWARVVPTETGLSPNRGTASTIASNESTFDKCVAIKNNSGTPAVKYLPNGVGSLKDETECKGAFDLISKGTPKDRAVSTIVRSRQEGQNAQKQDMQKTEIDKIFDDAAKQ